MKPPIYYPSGPAREYSPLALNTYLECGHGCKYCYVPSHIRKKHEDFHVPQARPRKTKELIKELTKQLEGIDREGLHIRDQVLLSFTCDPYSPAEDLNDITRQSLQVLAQYDVPTAILTKNPLRCYEADIDIIKTFSLFSIGTTFTFTDNRCYEWEPNAPHSIDRAVGLHKFKEEGIRSFVSLEPVIDAGASLNIIDNLIAEDIGDVVKLGKMNGYWESRIPAIDYNAYLREALTKLRATNKGIYVKEDLRDVTPEVQLTEKEKDPDFYALRRVVE